jgi:hypothetical protein
MAQTELLAFETEGDSFVFDSVELIMLIVLITT